MEALRTSLLVFTLQLCLGTYCAILNMAEKERIPDKVKLELFYETLCPSCHNYLVRELQPLLKMPDVNSILTVQMIAYGNAKTVTQNDGTTIFKCQHGQKECQGNIVHSCAIELFGFERAFEFIMCLEPTDKDWISE